MTTEINEARSAPETTAQRSAVPPKALPNEAKGVVSGQAVSAAVTPTDTAAGAVASTARRVGSYVVVDPRADATQLLASPSFCQNVSNAAAVPGVGAPPSGIDTGPVRSYVVPSTVISMWPVTVPATDPSAKSRTVPSRPAVRASATIDAIPAAVMVRTDGPIQRGPG